jgi:DNA-binding transcriptional MerR regulator
MSKRHTYTVQQLARLAGVSVRTLHHYDHIGLLKPSARTAAGYRQYGEADLLRLQQILFFKELDFPLADIQAILDDPGFDQVKALHDHQQMLQAEADRLGRLLKTIEKTISRLTEESMTPMRPSMTDEELYEGFTPEQIERYTREVSERYDPKIVAESNRRVRNMSKAQWQAAKAEGGAVAQQLVDLMDQQPGDAAVQAAIARHYTWVDNFWHPTAESYRGLGQGYAEHPEFRAFYDKYRPGLADFMCAAMSYYADHTLAE